MWVSQILEAMHAQIAQAHLGWEFMLHQLASGLGEQDLPSMPGAHDAGRMMHAQTHIVAFRGQIGFARVQAHANPNRNPFGPGVASESALGVYRG